MDVKPAVRSMITRTISHYEVLSEIGEGGMGVVYRAVDNRLGRPVAVKLLKNEAAFDRESKRRFVQEARAASALNHPHIVTIYDIGQDAGVDFIAMEYVAGASLASIIGQRRLSIDDALKYAVQIADALSTAHAAGILHRDLKPANVMVSDKGSTKVLDFGLAKLTESGSHFTPTDEEGITGSASRQDDLQTAEGTILGTTAYMSPEQAQGKPADARSDVFSFGVLLYEMITGRRAFGRDSRVSTLAAILTTEPEPPAHLVPALSRDLDRLIARCIRKNPDRRWQSMADLKVALEDLRDEPDVRQPGAAPVSPEARRWTRGSSLAIAALAIAVAATIWQTYRIRPGVSPRPNLTRLTSDVGWTDYPTISLDGKILAYASDRSGEGNLDIWVQHIPELTPVRLTRHAADDVDPSFSADGTRVAFQSSRGGGGIYVVPTLGGEERLLAPRGFSPRFSPDGNWIAYVVAEQGGGRIYVAPADGGPATPIAADFYRAQAHVWSPDGRSLLFWGQRRREGGPEDNVDWYVAAVRGGAPVPTTARAALLRDGFRAVHSLPFPNAWVRASNRILFHGDVGDSSNLWQVAISDRGRISGAPERATFGTTDEAAASVTADGRLVFNSRTMGTDIWTLPIDAEAGKPTGPLTRVNQDAADDYHPTLSEDGTTLVFRSRRSGRFGVILRKLGSSAETILTRMPFDHYPAISRDGTKVAYSVAQHDKMPIFVVAAGGGTPQQVCDNCGQVEEWSPRDDRILYVTQDDPSGIGILTVGASPNPAWLRHPGYGIYNPRLSSDGGWIAFNARSDRLSPARVFIAKAQAAAVAAEKDWIAVSSDGDGPSWSPQSSLLYFWSDRDGSPCLWAQRLEPETKRPRGAPLSIQHFHSRGLSWKNLYLGAPTIAVARDRIVFNLGQHTGNIWMTDLPRARD